MNRPNNLCYFTFGDLGIHLSGKGEARVYYYPDGVTATLIDQFEFASPAI